METEVFIQFEIINVKGLANDGLVLAIDLSALAELTELQHICGIVQ